jgi:flagellar hook-associated protein 2
MRVTAADADGNSTDAAGLSALAYDPAAAAGAGRNMTQGQAAQDALLKIDGIDVASASNTVTGALEGVTLQLRQVTTDPVTVDVGNDTTALRKNVTDFVNAYNALNKLLQAQTQADPSGASRGALQADSTAVNLLNGMRTLLRGSVAGLQEPASLAAAGVELQRDGSLSINEKKFAPLLEKPAQLGALFSQAGEADARGFAVRFKAWAGALTGTAGPLAARTEGLQRSIDGNRKQQDAVEDRLARTEARLRAQYQRLDSQMTALNAQMKQMAASLGLG